MAIEAEPLWSSLELWAVIAATGVITVLLTWSSDGTRAFLRNRRERQYAAMRCAVALEAYAVECWKIVLHGEGHFSLTQSAYIFEFPVAPAIPTDVDWKALKPQDADEVLSFMNSTQIAETHADFARIFESNGFEAQSVASTRGLYAIDLATRLRRDYGLPQRADIRPKLNELRNSAASKPPST